MSTKASNLSGKGARTAAGGAGRAPAHTKGTLFDKVWSSHVVTQESGCPAVLYVDLHLIHEVTSPQAFTTLREKGLKVARPERTVATMDHSTPTLPEGLAVVDAQASAQLQTLSM